jgi:hypothetical protein
LHLLRLLYKRRKKETQNPEVDLEIGQIKVLDTAYELELARHHARYEPSHNQIVALITRLATASRSAGLNPDHVLTDDDLRQMKLGSLLNEPATTQDELEHDVELIIANDSNGDFSQDECQIRRRTPVATRKITTIWSRNRLNRPDIDVYGLVHDFVVHGDAAH